MDSRLKTWEGKGEGENFSSKNIVFFEGGNGGGGGQTYFAILCYDTHTYTSDDHSSG